jgi:hypothetical protein
MVGRLYQERFGNHMDCCLMEAVVAICLEELRRNTNCLKQDSQCPSPFPNLSPEPEGCRNRFPMRSLDFFNIPNPSNQPTFQSSWWVKRFRLVRLTSCVRRLSRKCGIIDVHEVVLFPNLRAVPEWSMCPAGARSSCTNCLSQLRHSSNPNNLKERWY